MDKSYSKTNPTPNTHHIMDEPILDSSCYEYDYNTEYDDHDNDVYYSDDDSDNYDYDKNVYNPYVVHQEVWSQLRIGDHAVGVSTLGRVKSLGSVFSAATEGVQYPGTPYRVHRMGDNVYFVHDLVWRVFRGQIQPGYEIRHNSHYVQKRPRKVYTNRLECLTCERVTITRPF